MPGYTYQCNKCKIIFVKWVPMSEYDPKKVLTCDIKKCPGTMDRVPDNTTFKIGGKWKASNGYS